MAITMQSGSNESSVNLVTAIVSDTVLTGIGSFAEEVVDLLANGYKTEQIWSDGTNYFAFMVRKTWN